MRVNWKEVLKFLSGATFVGALANGYLYLVRVEVPFLGFTMSPEFLGFRALVNLLLFLVFFYLGFLKY